MKCANCDHEAGYHIEDEAGTPCVLAECFCNKYVAPVIIDRSAAFREACNILQEYKTKTKNCLCGHTLDKHYEQLTLPMEGEKQKAYMRCLVPGCVCKEFQ